MLSEFIWQLRRHHGVISLFWRLNDGRDELLLEVLVDPGTEKWRVYDGIMFEHQWYYRPCDPDDFDLAELARDILCEGEQKNVYEDEEFNGNISDNDLFERCRKFLTDHNWLIFIDGALNTPADWDLIRQHLLCESTRGCIVVITSHPSVAKHCVDYQQHRVVNIDDLRNMVCGRTRKPLLYITISNKLLIMYRHSTYYMHEYMQPQGSDGGGDKEVKEVGWFVGRKNLMRIFDFCDDHKVESLCGMPGVGKSAVVRQGYNHHKMGNRHCRMYGWVDVPHRFTLTDFCRILLLSFHSDDIDAKETALIGMMEGEDPIEECCKILRQNKYLIVIDGLCSTHDWDLIKATLFSETHNDGTTYVITREESIAMHCSKWCVCVWGLEADAALDLFKKITLDGKELSEFPHEAEATSELIISKCGGIPEIIVAAGKAVHANHMNFESVNARFMDILVDTSSSSSSLRDLFVWMQSYFEVCSDELKPCIFYLSVFSAGKSIRRNRLIRRWIAEGYLSHCGATAEKGKTLIRELVKLSILYHDRQTSTSSIKASGFFREYINSRPMEDNLVFELEGNCSQGSRLTGRHLTISSSWDREVSVFNCIDFSRLRSLTVFGKWVPFLVCDKMKLLRVLDLEGTSSTSDGSTASAVTDQDLEKIGKMFSRLKFLSLRGCKNITRLPDSMGCMRQLETLDARHTSIVELPPAIITKLHKLQYIRAGTNKASKLEAAAVAEATPPPQPSTTEEGVNSGMSPFLRATDTSASVVEGASTRITAAWKRRVHDLVESSNGSWWESKKQLDLRRRRARVDANGGGVEVFPAAAEGVGQLMHLHTLGVVNIAGGKGAILLLDKLKELTQLRKLGLSGINSKNWRKLCDAISGHLPHLESLSLQLLLLEGDCNYEFASFDDISELPNTLKRLKVLYTTTVGTGGGGACIRPAWLKKLPNLAMFDHELRISNQDDLRDVLHYRQTLSYTVSKRHLRIKPIERNICLTYYPGSVISLSIHCNNINSTISAETTGYISVEALSIHCCSSCGGSSCLQIVGLQHVKCLKQVLVTGPCSNDFKEDLRKQLDEHENKSLLKLLFTPDQ